MIPDPTNNGTLPPEHVAQREAGRQQRQADARLIATPIPPLEAALANFRYYALIGAIGLLALAIIVLLTQPATAGAAERPVAEPVEITTVTGDAGFYAIHLADGRIAMVLPTTKKTPALTPGLATLSADQRRLTTATGAYRVKWIRKGATK